MILSNVSLSKEEKQKRVKEMRIITMAGTIDCQKCLEITDYNIDKAILYLRTKYRVKW